MDQKFIPANFSSGQSHESEETRNNRYLHSFWQAQLAGSVDQILTPRSVAK